MRRRLSILLGLIVAATNACAGPAAAADVAIANVPRAAADPAFATDAASAINTFGIDLLQHADADGNLVFSPASIAIALGMTRAGAAGQTATEMDTVLHDLATDDHAAWLNALDTALASRSGSFGDNSGAKQPVSLHIANAPFAQRGFTINPTYLDALATRFGAGVRLVDYASDPEGARKTINDWVSQQTEQRIPELLANGSVTRDVVLTLVNAIYLKAAWQAPFIQPTTPAAFTRPGGSSVDVQMMHDGGFRPYASGDGWRAVELPYVGGSLAMTIIVPDDLASFETSLTADRLNEITAALAPAIVDLSLPKFSFETKLELGDTLSTMGMPSAFDPNVADFSGIKAGIGLHISRVIHQANIDVDEHGTTAAAATGVFLSPTGAPVDPITLTIDHPFLFALRDIPTGAVVFLGRVADPSAKG